MSITYYPGETSKMKMHVIEQLQQPNVLHSVFGSQDLESANLSVGAWCPKGWEIHRVSVNFSTQAARDYSISIVRGIGIATGKNDRLWVKVDSVSAQEIIIPQGFYTGSTLAVALATALDAGGFPSASKPFNVGYSSSTGLFTITPAAGNAQVFVENTTKSVKRISTAASLIGFTSNTTNTTPLTGNVSVLGLGTKMVYLSGNDSTSVDILSTDVVAMTIDNQILIETSGSLTGIASYEIVYKILDA